jgi:antitoxin MazE
MKVKIAKWGNSLGLRVPKAAADAAGVHEGTELDLVIHEGSLVMRPRVKTSRQLLEELVAEMKRLGPENEPESVEWGADVGSETIDDSYSRGEITLDDLLGKKPNASRGR